MTSRKIMRYMRELGYQYKPSLSKCGKHVFRRKADGKLTKPVSWAVYADVIRKHPRFQEVRRKLDRRTHSKKYRALVKAGVLNPAEGRRLERRERDARRAI